MNNPTAKTVENQYHHFVKEDQYAEAYDLITRHFDLFPGHLQRLAYLWRIDMACKLNNVALALQLLSKAVVAGYWYRDLLEDPVWQTLDDQAEFQRMVELCQQRRAKTIAEAKPVMRTMMPEKRSEPFPLLFALHGNGGNVEDFATHWMSAAANGWLVGLPQSPEPRGPDAFVWNDWDWVIPAVEAHYVELCNQHPIDQTKVVLAGFSMGAGLALWLAFNQIIDVQGVIVVAPFVNVEGLEKALSKEGNAEKRVFLVAGRADLVTYKIAHELSELLPSYGIQCELRADEAVDHAFPPNFDSVLPEALAFVSDDQ